MFGESTLGSLQNDINVSVGNDELFNKSSDFLMSKLEEYNKSDNGLSDTEIDNIETQLEYHLQLKELHQDFQSKKNKMRDNIKQNLSISFTDLQDSIISETHISEIDDILDQDLFDKQKGLIDDNLNVIGGYSGFFDGIDNTVIIQDFIDYFTLSLLNDTLLIKGNNIDLSLKELNKYLVKTIDLLINKNLEVPDLIELNTSNGIIEFNLRSIFDEIIEKKELLRIKIEKENSIKYKIYVLNNVLKSDSTLDELDYLQRVYSYKNDPKDGENNNITKLIYDLKLEGIINDDYIYGLFEDGLIKDSIYLSYSEKQEKFNLLEYYENNKLPKSVVSLGINYVRNTLKIKTDKVSDSQISMLLHKFTLVFLSVESDGRNVTHDKNKSSSKGYYQFLSTNGSYDKHGKLTGTSFHTGMNRIKNVLTQEDFKLRFSHNRNLDYGKLDPRDLSAENQTLLMFGNMFGKGDYEINKKTQESEFVNNKLIKDNMYLYFTETNTWSLMQLYHKVHHTKPGKTTIERFEEHKNKYFFGDKKLLVKKHY